MPASIPVLPGPGNGCLWSIDHNRFQGQQLCFNKPHFNIDCSSALSETQTIFPNTPIKNIPNQKGCSLNLIETATLRLTP